MPCSIFKWFYMHAECPHTSSCCTQNIPVRSPVALSGAEPPKGMVHLSRGTHLLRRVWRESVSSLRRKHRASRPYNLDLKRHLSKFRLRQHTRCDGSILRDTGLLLLFSHWLVCMYVLMKDVVCWFWLALNNTVTRQYKRKTLNNTNGVPTLYKWYIIRIYWMLALNMVTRQFNLKH